MTLQYTFMYDADRSSRTNKVNFCYQPLMSRPVLFYNISVLVELSRLKVIKNIPFVVFNRKFIS